MATWPTVQNLAAIARRASPVLWRAPWILLAAPQVWAKVISSQDAALKKAFPPPVEVRRKTLFLTVEQTRDIESQARAKVTSSLITYYEGWRNGKIAGTVFFDTQIVRTMPMTFMVLIQSDGTLGYVEVLSFYEPPDYLPRPGWLRLFAGKRLDDKLRLRWGIPNVTGASLTCQTLTDGVRRLLSTYQLALQEKS